MLKYGAEEILFEDIILNKNEKGDIVESKKEIRSKVFEKIYLDLQQDEIKFTHEPFKEIYNKLINCLLYTSPSPRDLSTSRMPSSA